jgi:hypothetical protein
VRSRNGRALAVTPGGEGNLPTKERFFGCRRSGCRKSHQSKEVAKTRKWIKAYLLRTLSERREGGDRLAAAPTPSQTFHALEATVAVSDSSWSLRPRKTVRSAAHI